MIKPLAILLAGAGLLAVALPILPGPTQAASIARVPAPAVDEQATGQKAGMRTAVFAGGCFWGIEGVFERVRGVTDVVSGYAGGKAATANYYAVGSGMTGHAEVVRITYDPKQVSYGTLLRVLFAVAHDPTQLNRQGPDSGTQYRSAIFPQDAGQARVARAYIQQLGSNRVFSRPVVTKVESGRFFAAEASHQDFMRRNPSHPYIRAHDAPKVAALRTAFPRLSR